MAYTYAGTYTGKSVPSQFNPGADPVIVKISGTPTVATLYTDRTKATGAANPLSPSAAGGYTIFADPGVYDITADGRTITVTVAQDPAEPQPPPQVGTSDPKIPVVLQWPKDTTAQVHCGENTWPNVNLGAFLWEFWCRWNLGLNQGYLFSAGYGPSHALLYGLPSGSPSGNLWNGTGVGGTDGNGNTSFAGAYTAQEGEWLHTAVGWDGTARIYVYVNGIVVGTMGFTGPRRADQSSGNGLYIGGSDHSNWSGAIAQVRGFEDRMPTRTEQVTLVTAAFVAERSMGMTFATTAAGPLCNFLQHYSQPGSLIVPDLSPGYNGRQHHGRLFATLSDYANVRPIYPGPQWVTDPTAPFRQDMEPARIRSVPTAPATPPGAKIVDSFSKADTCPTWASPTLGSTETGSLGPLVWQTYSPATWCTFNGYAVYAAAGYGLAWVNSNSADMEVRVTRDRTNGLDDTGATPGVGLAFRVQDANNFLALRAASGVVRLDSFIGGIGGGTGTNLGLWTPATTWVTLRVVTSGTSISCYVDNGAGGWILLGTVTSAQFQTAVGAGLYAYYGACSNVHYDNFTVV